MKYLFFAAFAISFSSHASASQSCSLSVVVKPNCSMVSAAPVLNCDGTTMPSLPSHGSLGVDIGALIDEGYFLDGVSGIEQNLGCLDSYGKPDPSSVTQYLFTK